MLIETSRLILREFNKEDDEHLYQLDNNKDVMRYIGSYHGQEITMENCKNIINKQIKYYKDHPGLGIFATCLKETRQFIGWTALKYLDQTNDVEIGYRYLPQYWNKGYATEASKSLLDYGFKDLKLEKIVAIANPKNKASIQVMKKIGMVYTRTDRYYNSDVVVYEINKEV